MVCLVRALRRLRVALCVVGAVYNAVGFDDLDGTNIAIALLSRSAPLAGLLTRDEIEGVRKSTINAHYTDPSVAGELDASPAMITSTRPGRSKSRFVSFL